MRNGASGGEGLTVGSPGDGGDEGKPPRLPRWTRREILVLIQGKRDTESRGRRGAGVGGAPPEPKWATISSYCRRHGVDRGPVQCRKRWSNLAGDFRKIKEWESSGAGESFWVMRNDVRRERKLPGFFDKEVYDVLDAGAGAVVLVPLLAEPIFDTGRPAGADDGLFSDGEPEEPEDGSPIRTPTPEVAEIKVERPSSPTPAVPITAGSHLQPSFIRCFDPGSAPYQPSMHPEKGSTSQAGQKRKKQSSSEEAGTNLQDRLLEILERNRSILNAQLEAQNINCQLDRNQRTNQANSLVGVLNKLADALGRIADKL